MNMALVIEALKGLASAVTWAFRNPRMAVEASLVAALLVTGWMYNRKATALDKTRQEAGGLEAELKQKIKIANGRIEVLTREGGKVVYRDKYVPPEGSVVISRKDQEAQKAKIREVMDQIRAATGDKEALLKKLAELTAPDSGDDEVVIKDKGFTLKPGFGADFANAGLKLRLDMKFAYWGRYSLLVGGSQNGAGPGISRHLDDILWGRPQNIEAFAGYNFITFDGRQGKAGVIGIRMNF